MVFCIRLSATSGTPFLQKTGRNQIHIVSAKYGLRPKSTASSGQKQERHHKQHKPIVLSQKSLASKHSPVFSTNTLKETPLVQRKPHKPLTLPLPIPAQTRGPRSEPEYEPEQKSSGVYAPRTRIAVGVILIGSIIYSMLTTPLQLTEAPPSVEEEEISKRKSRLTSNSPIRVRMEAFIQSQQSRIVSTLESLDPGHKFRTDTWTRPTGGGGISCVLQGGNIFEKAGVNTSIVYGTLPRAAVQKMRVNHKALDPNVESLEFFAAGLSLVLHPQNPMAPTVHLNYRYFETMNEDGTRNAWWFGGGTDLTPSYLFPEDVCHFHKTIKETCDKHDRAYYPRFKSWCDSYFRIPHRGESRGVGGIFFDDLDGEEKDEEEIFSFVEDCAVAFLPSYLPIIQRRMNIPFTEQQKEWQQLRRGRYVEFNLVNDRGTQFGLTTPNARVESILMSLPLTAKWMYMHEPEKGSWEENLLRVLREPVTWV